VRQDCCNHPLYKAPYSEVIEHISSEYQQIYVVDDACPEETGRFVKPFDSRVCVPFMGEIRSWWGSAAGTRQAAADGATVLLKLMDGQMDPALINRFVPPILRDEADYTGNRFYDLELLQGMPHGLLVMLPYRLFPSCRVVTGMFLTLPMVTLPFMCESCGICRCIKLTVATSLSLICYFDYIFYGCRS